ncbi:MAG: hypothetical protein OQK32_03995 [Gammaproteobacteria bacterium]|nr:hypothetical protein [Gammaproteobacteria bacterium]MCW8923687.1 hypothetical protein [Gammaproteobacteria bacterium]
MNELSLSIHSDNLMRALLQVPDKLEKEMGHATARNIKEIARSARHHAPKAFSTLTQSINDVMISAYEGLVAPGVDYAQAVEEGTDGGNMPPVQNILDWIMVRNIEPNKPDMDQEDLAFVMVHSIAHRGTPAQPYMQPALEDNRERAERRYNEAIKRALQ